MYNKAFLIGNLTKDPELRFIPSGTAVCSFVIATNRKYGEDKKETFFGDVVVWSKVAENCSKYLSKGSKVMIEGRLTTKSWDSDHGRRSKTEIVAERVIFLDHKKKDNEEPPEEHSELEPF